jgi:hypothetical protein
VTREVIGVGRKLDFQGEGFINLDGGCRRDPKWIQKKLRGTG